MADYGVPQKRRRHFIVASLARTVDLSSMLQPHQTPPRTVSWAILDLMHSAGGILDQPSRVSPINEKRINFLFRNNKYDLPNSLRPDCHRLKPHTYNSVYGRMHWDRPAQTLTSGFTSMGQGRYVHPECHRTITPHEAARLQFIPDFFHFQPLCNRSQLSEIIANAVPPRLTYILALELLR